MPGRCSPRRGAGAKFAEADLSLRNLVVISGLPGCADCADRYFEADWRFHRAATFYLRSRFGLAGGD